MSALAFDLVFDAALCVFNSFGYFADPGRDQAVPVAAQRERDLDGGVPSSGSFTVVALARR